jgi:hypothetical protein
MNKSINQMPISIKYPLIIRDLCLYTLPLFIICNIWISIQNPINDYHLSVFEIIKFILTEIIVFSGCFVVTSFATFMFFFVLIQCLPR